MTCLFGTVEARMTALCEADTHELQAGVILFISSFLLLAPIAFFLMHPQKEKHA